MTFVLPTRRLGATRQRLLRAIDHGRRRLQPGDVPLSIDALISPLRYDVLVRERYLRFVFEHLDVSENDFGALVAASRRHEYHAWFRQVAIRYVRPGAKAVDEIESAFEGRVAKTLALARSFAERGFDPRFPITVRSAGPVATTGTGKQLTGRRYPSDGCHRLALLRASGQRFLKPELYRIHEDRRWCPPDNTQSLIPALAVSRADYVAFISLGYADQTFGDADALLEHLRRHAPGMVDEVSRVMALDAALLSACSPRKETS